MHSYARGREAELLECTIHDRFLETMRRNPDGEALIVADQGVRLTWAELATEVERTARGLAGLGFGAGSRAGIWATNCAEWILLQLAAARAGVTLVNINPAYRAHELEYVLRKSRIEAIFLRESDERSCYREILERAMGGRDLPLKHSIYIGEGSWDRFIDGGSEIARVEASPQDVANIQYTSGTTGSPKGVLLSHRNVVNNGRFIGMWLGVTGRDRISIPVPLYHCFGCVIGVMVAINSGAAMVLPGARFHALPTMETVEREHCTLLYGVPTMFIAQLNHADFSKFDFSSLRGGIMAGAPCPVEIMKRVLTEMHCPEITIVYGQTESSPVITGATADDTLEHRTRTVGCAFPGTEVKLTHRETG